MDDKWFAETFPQFMCGNKPLEPFYSIASIAYDKGFQDGKQDGFEDGLNLGSAVNGSSNEL